MFTSGQTQQLIRRRWYDGSFVMVQRLLFKTGPRTAHMTGRASGWRDECRLIPESIRDVSLV
jgi:hypothetical protein